MVLKFWSFVRIENCWQTSDVRMLFFAKNAKFDFFLLLRGLKFSGQVWGCLIAKLMVEFGSSSGEIFPLAGAV
jgi:hypothetical protein